MCERLLGVNVLFIIWAVRADDSPSEQRARDVYGSTGGERRARRPTLVLPDTNGIWTRGEVVTWNITT